MSNFHLNVVFVMIMTILLSIARKILKERMVPKKIRKGNGKQGKKQTKEKSMAMRQDHIILLKRQIPHLHLYKYPKERITQ